jgi:hypothetical protein
LTVLWSSVIVSCVAAELENPLGFTVGPRVVGISVERQLNRRDRMSKICGCGCGKSTQGGTYRPGHDQSLRSKLERRVGGLSKLEAIVDAAEAFARNEISADAFGDRVQRTLCAITARR